VLISSAVFGAVHVLNALTIGSVLVAGVQAVAATMTGVVFAAVVIRTGSILPAIVLHALWDFGGLIAVTSAVQNADAADAASQGLPEISPILYLVPLLFNLPNLLYALFLLRRKRTGAEVDGKPVAGLSAATLV
jgi:hypothetical protein